MTFIDMQKWLLWTIVATLVLGIVLVAAKLLGIVSWAWWLVLLPFVPAALAVAAVILAILAWQASGSH